MTDRREGPPDAPSDRRRSFGKAEEQAREVLRERGFTPEQIEAQLKRTKRQSQYDG
jgi:hypothetical protein